jgi:murein tripeptide amidase MpaA
VIPDETQIEDLLEWRNEVGVDFWKAGAAGLLSRVMIPPELQKSFENFLNGKNLEFTIAHDDLENLEKEFETERNERLKRKQAKSAIDPAATPNFRVYWTSDEINAYSLRLAANYPHLVTREVIARTFEGRDVFALKISRGGFGRKPIIFMDGGMHAREWVSQATVTYFIHRLVEDPAVSGELLENVDWIIIPNLNPDGYNWAFTQNRLWRQNRNRINSTCLGVDLNRNWRYSWRAPVSGSVG